MQIRETFSSCLVLIDRILSSFKCFDFIPLLLLRLYLAPIFFFAGLHKLEGIDGVIAWFGSEQGLNLPFPALMAWLATLTELVGGILLLLGLGIRLISIPLSITMCVAVFAVHLPYGWLAIADNQSFFANERVMDSADKLTRAIEILKTHGNYEWLTSSGNFVILNNGIEFAVTYLVMLLVLLTSGGGWFVSVDYWVHRFYNQVK